MSDGTNDVDRYMAKKEAAYDAARLLVEEAVRIKMRLEMLRSLWADEHAVFWTAVRGQQRAGGAATDPSFPERP